MQGSELFISLGLRLAEHADQTGRQEKSYTISLGEKHRKEDRRKLLSI